MSVWIGPEDASSASVPPEIIARSALEWSIRESDLATCPKNRRCLSHRTVESCIWLLRLSTSVLETRCGWEIRRSLLNRVDMYQASSQAQ